MFWFVKISMLFFKKEKLYEIINSVDTSISAICHLKVIPSVINIQGTKLLFSLRLRVFVLMCTVNKACTKSALYLLSLCLSCKERTSNHSVKNILLTEWRTEQVPFTVFHRADLSPAPPLMHCCAGQSEGSTLLPNSCSDVGGIIYSKSFFSE